jgi:hypothetical protein
VAGIMISTTDFAQHTLEQVFVCAMDCVPSFASHVSILK